MNEMVNPHKTHEHARPWKGRYEDIVGAIENAIAPGRFLNLQMPVTLQKIWQALRG